jgi:hypothetical protein
VKFFFEEEDDSREGAKEYERELTGEVVQRRTGLFNHV